jgi:hypothetical protein
MAENIKITLRPVELYGTSKDYKVRPTLVDGPLFPSLKVGDKTDVNRLIGITYSGATKSVSQYNNQSVFDSINTYRSADIGYVSVRSTENTTLEYLPEHLYIVDFIENLERMEQEYPQKLTMLGYLFDNLFDVSYATGIHNFGRGDEVTPSGGIIESDGAFKISGYIIAETTDASVSMKLIIRGIPVPMRKTKTSANTYYFTYPQYLVDTQDSLDSVQHIEVSDSGVGSKYYFGDSHSFLKNSVVADDNDYGNLQIYNRVERNG